MNWDKNQVSLGDIKVGVRKVVTFKKVKDIPLIKTLTSSCNCSTPTYDSVKGEITVSFKPTAVPKHLNNQGWYLTKKSIFIVYIDGTKDVLYITAKVFK